MDGRKVNEEVKKVENNYKQWLLASGLSENDFLNIAKTGSFTIIYEKDTKYNIVSIGYNFNGKFKRIGQQLIYLKKDLSGFMDFSLLLLFMGQKLDENIHMFGKRKENHYDKIKNFIVGLEEYGIISK